MLGVAPGYYTDGDVAGESKASGAVSEIGLELGSLIMVRSGSKCHGCVGTGSSTASSTSSGSGCGGCGVKIASFACCRRPLQ